MYKIVQTDLLNIVLVGNIDTLENAKKRVEEMEETDKYLARVYGWLKLPEYLIVKEN